MTNKIRVFLSYRRADTRHVAGRAADRLNERFELFMDIDTIPPGVDFADYVRRAVAGCDVLLAFIGEHWSTASDQDGQRRLDNPQDWVAEEIRTALARDVRVIPILVDGARSPTVEELPPGLAGLAHRQALPLRHGSFAADITRLTRGIEDAGAERRAADSLTAGAALDQTYAARWEGRQLTPAAPRLPARIPVRRPGRRRLVFAAALVTLGGLAGAGVALMRSTTAPPSAAAPPLSTPVAPPARSPVRPPVSSLGELRRHVPAALRSNCRALHPEAPALRTGLTAAAQCNPSRSGSAPGPVYAFYFAYADPAASDTAFRSYYTAGDLPDGDCTSGPAERAYERRGLRGTLRCYTDPDGYRVLAWTSEELGMVAAVADRSLSYAELVRWWAQAGPLP